MRRSLGAFLASKDGPASYPRPCKLISNELINQKNLSRKDTNAKTNLLRFDTDPSALPKR